MKKNLLIVAMLMFCAVVVMSCSKKDDDSNSSSEPKENYFKIGSRTYGVEYLTLIYYGAENGVHDYRIELCSEEDEASMLVNFLIDSKTIPSVSTTYVYSNSEEAGTMYGCHAIIYTDDGGRIEHEGDDLDYGSVTISRNGDILEIDVSAKTPYPDNTVMSGYYKGNIGSYKDHSE